MRLTKKSNDNYVFDNYISLNEPWKSLINKLGQLEDIEEESGLCETGSSLLAFLQTPYIQSILKLYVDVRKLRGLSDKVDNCEMNDYNV